MTYHEQAAAIGQALIDQQAAKQEFAAIQLTLTRIGQDLAALGQTLTAPYIPRTITFSASTILIESAANLGEPARTLSRKSFNLDHVAQLLQARAAVQERLDVQQRTLRGITLDNFT